MDRGPSLDALGVVGVGGGVANTPIYVQHYGHALDLSGPIPLAAETLDSSTHSVHSDELLQVHLPTKPLL